MWSRRMRLSTRRGGWGEGTVRLPTMMKRASKPSRPTTSRRADDEIRVVVHRQSVVHGRSVFREVSVLHAALPDMRLPISYGILYPDRVDVGAKPVPFGAASWTFEEPRNDVFRCLALAVGAGRAGGAYPVALNGANEIVVQAFLDRRIQFMRIPDVIEEVLDAVPEFGAMESMQAIVAVDRWAREEANKAASRYAR